MEIFKIVLDLKYRNKTSNKIIVIIMQNILTIKEVILTFILISACYLEAFGHLQSWELIGLI